MDTSLNRITTSDSNAVEDSDGGSLNVVFSAPGSGSRTGPPAPLSDRRSSSTHALLGANITQDLKKSAQAETYKQPTDKVSLSMPPPLTKPNSDRRLSASISSLRSARKSDDLARSPPNSVKSLDATLPFVAATSPRALTTATDATTVTTSSQPNLPGLPVLSPPAIPSHASDLVDLVSSTLPVQMNGPTSPSQSTLSTSPNNVTVTNSGPVAKADGVPTSEGTLPNRAPRGNIPRSISSTRRLSTTTQRSDTPEKQLKKVIGRIGVCALDVKARSRPSRQILTRLQGDGEFEVIVFGDKAILDEAVENWPICDFLIAFYSEGFPLDKAIAYVKLRKPFAINDLAMQKVLWDRRLCLRILDQMHVRSPKRVEVNRDGGPTLESAELAQHLKKMSGVKLSGPPDGTGGGAALTKHVALSEDGDSLIVDGQVFKKPFVEKPVDGDDHNVIIYFPKSHEGGGARRLFRKIGNKSSEFDPELTVPRCITEPNSSYIYEQFLKTDNAEDVKAYTVGTDYCHAETRKSPVVDGLVRRNTHGKELRYVTKLNTAEREMAARVSRGFGQRICGFDLLRANNHSYVIDVNGWSFVKDNEDYYNDCAKILKAMFSAEKFKQDFAAVEESTSEPPSEGGPHRSNTAQSGHSHRSALKTILKSPSMKNLAAHVPHPTRHHAHSVSSPKPSKTSVPLSSPATMERAASVSINLPPSSAIENTDLLPPPVVETAAATESVYTEAPVPTSTEQEAQPAPMPSSRHSWKLKGVVTVIRHADRTPKQKLKFTAHSQVFVDLLKGHNEEVLLKGEAALASVEAAVKTAQAQGVEDQDKLRNLRNALAKKGKLPATKVQIKPMFRKRKAEEIPPAPLEATRTIQSESSIPEYSEPQLTESPTIERPGSMSNGVNRGPTRSDSLSGATFSRFAAAENDLILDKLQLVMKWGGEPTHSARYQSADLGANMREDFMLLNKEVLDDVRIFTSSEKRVKISAQIWAAAFLGRQDIPEDFISIRKDLLDDSNAAKDVMDKVKKKLKHLLREGNSVPEQFAWPKDVAQPSVVMQTVIELLKFHRKVMRHNFKRLAGGAAAASLAALSTSGENKDLAKEGEKLVTVASIQSRWCTGEDEQLFKERWEKLFSEFCDTEKADPSKVSELYDTMKYDALHNRQFLEWAFTPTQALLDEITKEEALLSQNASPEPERVDEQPGGVVSRHDSINSLIVPGSDKQSFAQKIGLRRKSVLTQPPSTPPLAGYEQEASYFKLFGGSGDSKAKQDKRLGRLRELYRYSKILFDYIGPQEYGISDHEKLEIGLLTSLPLLREIVQDLEELQASGDAKSFIYFTKESHIYTLLNCIMEGGIHTKIKRTTIPELDYLSQICFELYEAKDAETEESTYSIRISISPGCHTIDPLDVSLDSKHAIGSAPRRSLTNHQDWKDVISTLKAKFDTVQLPKSFLAVNVSDKHEAEAEEAEGKEELEEDKKAVLQAEENVSKSRRASMQPNGGVPPLPNDSSAEVEYASAGWALESRDFA